MRFEMRPLAALIGVAVGLWAGTAQARAFNLTFAAAQGLHLPWVGLTRTVFIKGVDARLAGSGHEINWTQAYGGTALQGRRDAGDDRGGHRRSRHRSIPCSNRRSCRFRTSPTWRRSAPTISG